MQPYQQRVIDEKSALDDKLTKLTLWLAGPQVAAPEEQARLMRQQEIMSQYSAILDERIKAFQLQEA